MQLVLSLTLVTKIVCFWRSRFKVVRKGMLPLTTTLETQVFKIKVSLRGTRHDVGGKIPEQDV